MTPKRILWRWAYSSCKALGEPSFTFDLRPCIVGLMYWLRAASLPGSTAGTPMPFARGERVCWPSHEQLLSLGTMCAPTRTSEDVGGESPRVAAGKDNVEAYLVAIQKPAARPIRRLVKDQRIVLI